MASETTPTTTDALIVPTNTELEANSTNGTMKTCNICNGEAETLKVTPITCFRFHGEAERACNECWEAQLSLQVEELDPRDIECMFCSSIINSREVKRLAFGNTFKRYVDLWSIDDTTDFILDTSGSSGSLRNVLVTSVRLAVQRARASTTASRLISVSVTDEYLLASSAASTHARTAIVLSTLVRRARTTVLASSMIRSTAKMKKRLGQPGKGVLTATISLHQKDAGSYDAVPARTVSVINA